MRKTLIMIGVPLLLLWSACAFAYHRPIAKPCFGDPDEFQAHRYHDEGGRGVTFPGYTRRAPRTAVGNSSPEQRETEQDERRYLSIHFAGRTFFLEK
jgi:hypothetical protein